MTDSKGIRVKVYRNLHKGCYSVVAMDGPQKGRVIAHEKRLMLTNATFHVSEAGRQRVLREQRKNVHATIRGNLVTDSKPMVENMKGDINVVTYNPYKKGSFFMKHKESVDVTSADQVYFGIENVLATGVK